MCPVTDFLFPQRQRGFTLVEMIIAIVVTGVLVGIVAMFGRRQIDNYIDVGNRAELADTADTALRRIARDLNAALPNSVRQSGNLIEFVPVRDGGRYRAESGGAPGDDPLEFDNNADSSFDVFGPPVSIGNGEQLVIFNLGQPGSDVYAGTSRRAASAGSNLTKINFAPAGVQFPLASPQSRFHIVGGPVSYECAANAANPAAGRLWRHSCYAFQAAQPTGFGGLTPFAGCAAVQSSMLAGDVAACSITYLPAVLQRNGLVVLSLRLSRNGESVSLLHQVEVLNTP